jgi:single-stranded DNA-binding protein
MITITASGFVPRKPELQLVGAKRTPKCEFDVLDSRRTLVAGQWESVWESVTFVAWAEEAESIAERLDKGYQITCTGLQETSHWTDQAGAKHKAIRYRLTAWDSKPPRQNEAGDGRQQQPEREQQHPARQQPREPNGNRNDTVQRRGQGHREPQGHREDFGHDQGRPIDQHSYEDLRQESYPGDDPGNNTLTM